MTSGEEIVRFLPKLRAIEKHSMISVPRRPRPLVLPQGCKLTFLHKANLNAIQVP